MKQSKDGKVIFDPIKHIYFYGDKVLPGVTTYISRFKNKFDADKVAESYAKKHRLNKEELLIKWKLEGDLSRENGVNIHLFFENYFLKGELVENEKNASAVKFIKDFFEPGRLTCIDVEVIVYNERYASQIDCVVKNRENEYFILDWKTCKSISDNGYNKFMLAPYDKYPDANYYHYSLQLSIYKELYKEHHVKDAYIIHLNGDGYKIIKPEYIYLNE